MKKAVVAGAGLAGCSAARILAEHAYNVFVIEKRNEIGGNCHDIKNALGITVHSYGPHIFHTGNQAVWGFVNRFAAFNSYEHRVLSCVEGKMVPFPVNLDTINQALGVTLRDDQEVAAFLAEEVKQSQVNIEKIESFRDAIVAQVGQRLYDLFFRNYTQKQWQRSPEKLSKDLAGRIPIRTNHNDRYFPDSDLFQGLPIGGYTQLCERMLAHPNIRLLKNTDYFEYSRNNAAELTVYTGQLDQFFDYTEGELQYRSVIFDFEDIEKEAYQPAAVVNYPNEHAFTRITEFKKMTLETSKGTTICKEYPSASGVPCYVLPDEENQRIREKYLLKTKSLEAAGQVCFVGRLAEYRYYDMDDVVAAVMEKLQRFTDTSQ